MLGYMTDVDLVRRMCTLIEGGVPINSAAAAVGYTKSRISMIMAVGQDDAMNNNDSVFCKCYLMILDARGKAVKELVGKIKEAGETDWKANTYLLERMDPDNFGPASINPKGDGDGGITVVNDMKIPELAAEPKMIGGE